MTTYTHEYVINKYKEAKEHIREIFMNYEEYYNPEDLVCNWKTVKESIIKISFREFGEEWTINNLLKIK